MMICFPRLIVLDFFFLFGGHDLELIISVYNYIVLSRENDPFLT